MAPPQLERSDHELLTTEFGTHRELLGCLGQSDQPRAVMLTCWELGGIPDQVAHANPGEIMIVQNPGGLVESADALEKGSAFASVAYCLEHPAVRHLIVCGHTQCKTLAALLGNETKGTLDTYRQILACVSRRFEELYAQRPEHEWLRIVAQESVLQQLANLRGHTTIRSRLRNGSLSLHGWMRDDETSVVAAFDPVSGQFSD